MQSGHPFRFIPAGRSDPFRPLLAAPPEQERYIVVLHETVESPEAVARGIASQVGGQAGYIYEHALKGFTISVPIDAPATFESETMIHLT